MRPLYNFALLTDAIVNASLETTPSTYYIQSFAGFHEKQIGVLSYDLDSFIKIKHSVSILHLIAAMMRMRFGC